LKPLLAFGWRPIPAYTCGNSSAARSAARHDAPSMPTVSMRVTPACRAAATSSATGGSHRSRCVCESITPRPRGRSRARRLRVLREQRLDRAHALHVPAAELGAGERAVARAERVEQALGAG